MITSYSNGHKIEYIDNDNQWVYSDTKEDSDINRPCPHCGKLQSAEGYDGCIGYLPNVKSACCGHGIEKPYIVTNDGEYMQFENVKELKEYVKNNKEGWL